MSTGIDTVFLRPRSGRSAGTGVDTEFADQISGRLAIVAALMIVISVIALALSHFVPDFGANQYAGKATSGRWPLYVQLVASLIVGGLAWRRLIPTRWVITATVLYQILVCWEASVGITMYTLTSTGAVPVVTFCEVLIVFFPLIIPTRPGTVLIAAVASGATRIPSALSVSAWLDVPLEGSWYIPAIAAPSFAVMMALAGSKVVYGLRRQADQAKSVGSYQLEKQIGQGGMGEVWRARHQMLARPAAIKFIRRLAGGDVVPAAALERFEREARATAKLKSPHTVQLYDYGRARDGSFYYVMELLEGVTLRELVERYGPVRPARAIHFAEQMCHSLAEAHAGGLVHRDIKPANVIACRYGLEHDHLVVVDFGLVAESESAEGSNNLTAANQTIGTPAYMAPEAARGQTIDHRADIYAIGCVLFWMMSGRLVFESDSAVAMAVSHASEEPPLLNDVSEWDIDEPLASLVAACLAKNPAERPQSAQELAHALAAVELDEQWTSDKAATWWERHHPLDVAGQ
jgi:serine/threonine-protein kinase